MNFLSMSSSSKNLKGSEGSEQEIKDDMDRMRIRICELEKKVVSFDTLVEEKQDLQEQMNGVGKWVNQVTRQHKEMFAQLSASYDSLWAKHQEIKTVESKLRCEKGKLNDDNDRMTEQVRLLKRNEQKLSAEIERTEKQKKRIKIELCDFKTRVNDLNTEVSKIRCSLNSKEESICTLRKQLDKSRREYDRSRDATRKLESDLKRANEEMVSAKACAATTEQKLAFERDTVSNELECKRRKVAELQSTFVQNKTSISDRKTSICKLESRAADLRAANERERRDTVARIKKLTGDNCRLREESALKCREIEQLHKKNDYQACELNDQKRQMSKLNCAVGEMRCAAEKIKHKMQC